MCQNSTDSQKPLSGAWAKVQGHATAQLQLSNHSPTMCQLGISAMGPPFATNTRSSKTTTSIAKADGALLSRDVADIDERFGNCPLCANNRQHGPSWSPWLRHLHLHFRRCVHVVARGEGRQFLARTTKYLPPKHRKPTKISALRV